MDKTSLTFPDRAVWYYTWIPDSRTVSSSIIDISIRINIRSCSGHRLIYLFSLWALVWDFTHFCRSKTVAANHKSLIITTVVGRDRRGLMTFYRRGVYGRRLDTTASQCGFPIP